MYFIAFIHHYLNVISSTESLNQAWYRIFLECTCLKQTFTRVLAPCDVKYIGMLLSSHIDTSWFATAAAGPLL